MNLKYERSGGFAGMRDVVQVDGDALKITRRGQPLVDRKLSADEAKALQAMLAKAKTAAVPEPKSAGRVSDGFRLSLTVDAEESPRVTMGTVALPSAGEAGGEPWTSLMGYLEELLTSSIQAQAGDGGVKVLKPSDL